MSNNTCGYIGRLIILALATGGILLSYVALDTCEFISFENKRGIPWENLEPPFDQAVSAHVGIFSYEIVEAGSDGVTTGKCVNYDDRYADMIDFYESIAASQFCAVVAPSLALFAMALNLFEFFVCGFHGSFIFSSLLYFFAAGIQAGTFSMLAEPAICFEDKAEQDCSPEMGAYLSGAALVCYFLSSMLMCCIPRPDPFCDDCGRSPPKNSTTEDQSSSRQFQNNNSNNSNNNNENNDNNDNKPERSLPPKKNGRHTAIAREEEPDFMDEPSIVMQDKKSNGSDNDDSFDKAKINDEEFFEGDTPAANASRVEVKEKTFPDGSREVEETTHFQDGTTSVKTY